MTQSTADKKNPNPGVEGWLTFFTPLLPKKQQKN